MTGFVKSTSVGSRDAGREWQYASAPAGTVEGPGAALDALEFRPVAVPGSAARALADASVLDLEHPPDIDACDHFWRARLDLPDGAGRRVLAFDGLATLADVWVGARHVLSADNMFRRYAVDVTDVLADEPPVVVLRFRSVDRALAQRRPRPRWRTRVVQNQQLRWIRTSLIGRTPGFCPALPVVGPYRPVRLELRSRWASAAARALPILESDRGRVRIALEVEGASGGALLSAEAQLSGAAGHGSAALTVREAGGVLLVEGELSADDTALWWPNGYGAQPLSALAVELRYADGGERIDLGRVGFRRLERAPDARGFGLIVNGVPVFCRGACWTADDLVSAGSSDPRATLELVRRAGATMLRVGGTTLYESDAFYDACDELGILVWQDFMFANMDYPATDAAFVENVRVEAAQQLGRLAARPSLAVLCGGSEVEQQAAMLGLPSEQRRSALFDELLPELVERFARHVPYLPSSPTGGTLPFHTDDGVAHYYGYGAYLRDPSDIRASDVRFASECLAFACIPDGPTLETFLRDLETPPHHPRWKARVPRDRGAGWDFDDVRDWYVGKLFRVDPLLVRYSDVERYLALGRAAVADAMERVFSEWRRPESSCRGGLVWFLKDFWAGAGWGVIDALGRPKSAFYALQRVWAPTVLLCSDEGLNGHALHAVNDTGTPLAARLELTLFREGSVQVARGTTELDLPAFGGRSIRAEALLGSFHDTTRAYRFGPAGADLLVARLLGRDSGAVLGRAFAFPSGLPNEQHDDIGLAARFAGKHVRVSSRRFAQNVHIEVPGCRPGDDYFHLAPGETREIELHGAEAPSRGWVTALNCSNSATLTDAGGTPD